MLIKIPNNSLVAMVGISGSGKCVAGNTMILTENGFSLIEEHSLDKDDFSKKEQIIATNEGLFKTSHFFEENSKCTYKINTDMGAYIEGTPEHPILVINKNAEFEYRQLQDIEENAYACIKRNINVFSTVNKQINFIQERNGSYDRSILIENIPTEITPNIARLMGYIVANASMSKDVIHFSTRNELIRNDIISIIVPFKQTIGKVYDDSFTVGRQWLGRLIKYLFDTNEWPTARFKYVPKSILTGTKEIQVNFLRGLIDCDSYSNQIFELEYSTASKQLIEQVQLMLLNLGIVSIIKPKYVKKYNHIYWRLFINGRNLKLYKNIIGSIKYTFKLNTKNSISKDIIPHIKDIAKQEVIKVKKLLNVSKNGKCKKYKRFPHIVFNNGKNATYDWLNYLLNKINKIEEFSLLKDKIEVILKNNYFFSPVNNIAINSTPQKVYDFTIPKYHNFITNGFISHNSSFAYKYFNTTLNPIVSSDRCRLYLQTEPYDITQKELQKYSNGAFHIFHATLEAKLMHNQLAVADATNLNPESRQRLEQIAKAHYAPIYYIVLNTPLETCIARDKARDEYGTVGEGVVRKQHSKFRSTYNFLKKNNNVFIVNSDDEVTVELIPTNNTIDIDHGIDIVGDVHGTFLELNELLGKLGYVVGGQRIWHPDGRKICFVGDVCDRGPENYKCIELAKHIAENNMGWWCMSNNDNKLMRYLNGRKINISHGLDKTIAQIPESEYDSLKQFMYKNLKSYYHFKHTSGEEIVVTHGAFKKEFIGKSHRDIDEVCFYGITAGVENGLPKGINWASNYVGPFVVFGHNVESIYPVKYKHAINIDTGCVFGGNLSSYSFPEKTIIQVKAKHIYDNSKSDIPENMELTIQDLLNTNLIEVEDHKNKTIKLCL